MASSGNTAAPISERPGESCFLSEPLLALLFMWNQWAIVIHYFEGLKKADWEYRMPKEEKLKGFLDFGPQNSDKECANK